MVAVGVDPVDHRRMYLDDLDEPDDGPEPAPAGFSDDHIAAKKQARQLYEAGDYQGALSVLTRLYDEGMRYPVTGNIAVCHAQLGNGEAAASWMAAAIEDANFPFANAYPASDRESRAGWLECYFQWSRGNTSHHG